MLVVMDVDMVAKVASLSGGQVRIESDPMAARSGALVHFSARNGRGGVES